VTHMAFKSDPNEIRKYRRKWGTSRFKPSTRLEGGKRVVKLRLPLYLFDDILKESNETNTSLNAIIVQRLEAELADKE
jgi:hypothetical protein